LKKEGVMNVSRLILFGSSLMKDINQKFLSGVDWKIKHIGIATVVITKRNTRNYVHKYWKVADASTIGTGDEHSVQGVS
jgi:hypothetical protein